VCSRDLSRYRQLAGHRPAGAGWRYLPTHVHPDFNEVVRSSQSNAAEHDALLKRADRILAFAESGKGSLGKLIYDPSLYDRFSQTVGEFKGIVDTIAKGEGSLAD